MSNTYPEFFFSFSCSTKESVKAIGNKASGWTSGELIRTRLLNNLEELANRIREGFVSSPICVFLVGGPGNGKTEAAEYFLQKLYDEVPVPEPKVGGHLIFRHPVSSAIRGVVVVEDATELPSGAFKRDVLEFALRANSASQVKDFMYLCCVNRGVLADAINTNDQALIATNFISLLSDSVSVGETCSQMWPLSGNRLFANPVYDECTKSIYVWPMDAESLVDPHLYGGDPTNTPGYKLFRNLIDTVDASGCESCTARECCPFWENLEALRTGKGITDILYCLHAYEIAVGKKILFRDLLAVSNVLLVDSEEFYRVSRGDRTVQVSPCAWVKHHAEILRSDSGIEKLASAFKLASRRYNQVLFGDYSEFKTKDVQSLKSRLQKMSDVEEFKAIARLIKAIGDVSGHRKNSTRAWEMVHDDICKRMDIALEEGIDDLESIEIGFCSSTQIGANDAVRRGVASSTLKNVLGHLIACEDGLGNHVFDVSTDRGDACRRCLQILQVLGSRMSKREVGMLQPAVYNYQDIAVYEKICFEVSSKEDLNYVKKPLQKVLSLGDKFSAHVLQSIGQTRVSPKYVFSIQAENKCKITVEKSSTLPVSTTVPVDPTPDVVIKYSYGDEDVKPVRIPLTFSLFYALRKVREGLNVASISEQTFVSLNLLSSKLLGIITHHAEEPRFLFPESEEGRFVWLSDRLMREEEE